MISADLILVTVLLVAILVAGLVLGFIVGAEHRSRMVSLVITSPQALTREGIAVVHEVALRWKPGDPLVLAAGLSATLLRS